MRAHKDYSDLEFSPNWRIIFRLIPYLMEYKARVAFALSLLVGAKLANVAVPIMLKYVVDGLDPEGASAVAIPMVFLLAYGGFRFATVFLGEMRDAVFARVTERAMRRIGLSVFKHLHALDLDFHLSRKTGGLSRDIERGTSSISFLLRFLLFNIVPTLLEIAMVAVVLFVEFSVLYVIIIVASVCLYIAFSVVVTEWRTKFVRETNKQDSQSHTRAIDSLLNYETVKYFNNEEHEFSEYDKHLSAWEKSRLKNRMSLAALNSGQALIIASSMTLMMVLAANGVVSKELTIGDFVMVNAFMIQLFIPLNFLGFVYREIRQSLINIEKMFELLGVRAKIKDKDDAVPLKVGRALVEFDRVRFSYDQERTILKDISLSIGAGKKIAIVGGSGAGKSTIAKLLFRFYDVESGSILVDGQNIQDVSQSSLRESIGVVPQDTVLFNESIYYNIAYGKPGADRDAVERAAQMAHLSEFIARLPQGYETVVGERGLKLSGGEKQRIAIARTLLKAPEILIFDEATSALDSQTEKMISEVINEVFRGRTMLVIAHRLSTIMDADQIIVLEQGEIVERGIHQDLINQEGVYASLWHHQQQTREAQHDGS